MHTDIRTAYTLSRKRLFLLDYDGTLADLKPTPLEAVPTPDLITLLRRLGDDEHNTVVIVSGRRHQELDNWLGDLPVSLAAEHGLLHKQPGGEWQLTMPIDISWKPTVTVIMKRYTEAVRGSLIEDKTDALVWHYRNAENTQEAKTTSQRLIEDLKPPAQRAGLRIMQGDKVVEVLAESTNKGLTTQDWLKADDWDFILIAGDDTTDEDMFAVAPQTAFTVKVRPGNSKARIRVASASEMRTLLASL